MNNPNEKKRVYILVTLLRSRRQPFDARNVDSAK